MTAKNKKRAPMKFDNVSWKEVPIRTLLMSSANWEYIRDVEKPNTNVKYVLAKCNKCGTEQIIASSLFYRRLCMVPCPVCMHKVAQMSLGMIIDNYKIINVDEDRQPMTCTIQCMNCGRYKYGVDINSLFFRKYKYALCNCDEYPIENIDPVIISPNKEV